MIKILIYKKLYDLDTYQLVVNMTKNKKVSAELQKDTQSVF